MASSSTWLASKDLPRRLKTCHMVDSSAESGCAFEQFDALLSSFSDNVTIYVDKVESFCQRYLSLAIYGTWCSKKLSDR